MNAVIGRSLSQADRTPCLRARGVLVSRFGARAEFGWLRGYLSFGFFVLPSYLCRQVVIVTHDMSLSTRPLTGGC